MPTDDIEVPNDDLVGLSDMFTAAEAGDPRAQEAIRGLTGGDDPGRQAASIAISAPDPAGDGRSLLSRLAPTLLPTAIGGIADLFGADNFAMGMYGAGSQNAQNFLQLKRDEQMEMMRRRQKVWDTQYQEAQNLPSSVYSDPKYANLAAAAQAFMKDMKDGKLDNEKTYTTFMQQKALFEKDIQSELRNEETQLEIERLSQVREAEDELNQADMAKQLQILQTAEPGSPEHQQAYASLEKYGANRTWNAEGGVYETPEQIFGREQQAASLEARSQEAAADRALRLKMHQDEMAQANAKLAQAQQAFEQQQTAAGIVGLNQSIGEMVNAETAYLQAALQEAVNPEEKKKILQELQNVQGNVLEKNRDKILMGAQASDVLLGVNGDQLTVAGEPKPVYYPSDDTMRAAQQAVVQARVGVHQAHVQSPDPANIPIAEQKVFDQPGWVESQAKGPQVNLRAQAQSRLEQAETEYNRLLAARAEALNTVMRATREKGARYGVKSF